jgi:hypothetical protein
VGTLAVGGLVLLFAFILLASWRITRRHGGKQAGPSLAEIEADAGRALVVTDDSVRTSDAELGFAVARFGEQAARPFSAALSAARTELAAAFRLRQLLDDDVSGTQRRQRAMLTGITARCAQANRLLDEQAAAFDQLQDLEATAARVLAEVEAHVIQQAARLDLSRQILGNLTVKYTAPAVSAAAGNPDEAAGRLAFATASITGARQSLAADQAARASVFLQAAESAADQASDLLGGVEHLEAELTQARSALPVALRELDADIAAAIDALAGQQPDAGAAQVARARSAAAKARGQADGGPFDSLTTLHSLQRADAALDEVLASASDERDRQQRAKAVLDQAMLLARSSLTAAEDFISARRAGVGAQARTRLAEARRHYQQAVGRTPADPVSALGQARRCDAHARQARALAGQDVAQFRACQLAAGSGGAGPGGSAAILGGILIDGPPGTGDRGGGSGPRRSPSGFGGDLRPASFGGRGSRSRPGAEAGAEPRISAVAGHG